MHHARAKNHAGLTRSPHHSLRRRPHSALKKKAPRCEKSHSSMKNICRGIHDRAMGFATHRTRSLMYEDNFFPRRPPSARSAEMARREHPSNNFFVINPSFGTGERPHFNRYRRQIFAGLCFFSASFIERSRTQISSFSLAIFAGSFSVTKGGSDRKSLHQLCIFLSDRDSVSLIFYCNVFLRFPTRILPSATENLRCTRQMEAGNLRKISAEGQHSLLTSGRFELLLPFPSAA